MGNCKYCGKPAGLLKSEHIECAEKYRNGFILMVEEAKETALGRKDKEILQNTLSRIAAESHLSKENIRLSLIYGFSNALDVTLEDGILTPEEQVLLTQYIYCFSLDEAELDLYNRCATRFVKARVLREVLSGKLPERIEFKGGLLFNPQKDEQLVWLFTGVNYIEKRTRTHFEGRSQGVSFKVLKGVYYRTGAFRGNPVAVSETAHDRGSMSITNKNIYFHGSTFKFRVPYKRILEFTPYSDGLGILKDSASATQQIFVNGDGWFTYNLVTNLSQM